MAIMYNGNVPITRANVDGRLFDHIGGPFGRVLYSFDELYAYSYRYACFNFAGFEYKQDSGYWARAVVCFTGQADNDAVFKWRDGCPSSECVLCIDHSLFYQLGCIDLTYCARGNYCGDTYSFNIISSPSGTGSGYCSVLHSNSLLAAIPQPAFDGFTLRSPWVSIHYCDYVSDISCSGLSIHSNRRGILYPRYINTMFRQTNGIICYMSRDLQPISGNCREFYVNIEEC